MRKSGKIQPVDLRAGYLAHKSRIDKAVGRVLDSGWYILGGEVARFEKEYAGYLGACHAIGVASGTDALVLALRACSVGPGDKVLTVSHTAVATVAAIEICGARPVLVDIEPSGYTLDPERLEEALQSGRAGEGAKAVIVVHLYGHPADVGRILPIARRHGLSVVEDCAQAHGASVDGQLVGTLGDVAAFSFYPTKNLGALGDGGAVVTSSAELAERVGLLRQYGWRERYVSEISGYNSRLDELQAAVLSARLEELDRDNEQRRRLAEAYRGGLDDLGLELPGERRGARHVYHQFVVRCRQRDKLRAHLGEMGIGTLVHYPVPVHLQPAYRDRIGCAGSLARSEAAAQQVLSLPLYPQLEPEAVSDVCAAIRAWYEDNLVIR